MNQMNSWRFLKAMGSGVKLGMRMGVGKDVPIKQFMIIGYVIERTESEDISGVLVSDIADAFEVSRPATTQILNILEEKGYLSRSVQESDRRQVKIMPTKLGKKLLQDVKEKHLVSLEEVIDEFGEEKTSHMISLLEEFHEIVKKKIETE